MNSLKIHGSRSFMRVATTRSACKEWTYLRVKSVADDRVADLAHVMGKAAASARGAGHMMIWTWEVSRESGVPSREVEMRASEGRAAWLCRVDRTGHERRPGRLDERFRPAMERRGK